MLYLVVVALFVGCVVVVGNLAVARAGAEVQGIYAPAFAFGAPVMFVLALLIGLPAMAFSQWGARGHRPRPIMVVLAATLYGGGVGGVLDLAFQSSREGEGFVAPLFLVACGVSCVLASLVFLWGRVAIESVSSGR